MTIWHIEIEINLSDIPKAVKRHFIVHAYSEIEAASMLPQDVDDLLNDYPSKLIIEPVLEDSGCFEVLDWELLIRRV